ncbi:hypothetical protein K0I73_18145 [Shewanella mesophila]|uniref:hypothetical protein n=1 Tax=Shewanella mesophila TaxID=2864208 RepID=UPI001C6619B6|nr:hypothetical protein [Shewanella mesophila]QYJ86048.1 hypothetical protein K0I73_18145 [Shewanella mesophila]
MSAMINTLRLISLFAVVFISPIAANEPTEPLPLPANSALDSDGNPIVIPKDHSSALHYTSEPIRQKPTIKPSQKNTKKSSKKSHRLSRKQQLASRQSVADNPSCRWLNQRMTQLEKSLKKQRSHQFGYQAEELKARKSEWVCMKCGAEGPNQNDHHKCQYKR